MNELYDLGCKYGTDKATHHEYMENVYTSGDAALSALENNKLGKYFYHLGPQKDEDLFMKFILFKKIISSWGSYTPGVDISTDRLDNDGDGLIDAEDSDENGSPRESALSISVRKLTADIVSEINNTW